MRGLPKAGCSESLCGLVGRRGGKGCKSGRGTGDPDFLTSGTPSSSSVAWGSDVLPTSSQLPCVIALRVRDVLHGQSSVPGTWKAVQEIGSERLRYFLRDTDQQVGEPGLEPRPEECQSPRRPEPSQPSLHLVPWPICLAKLVDLALGGSCPAVCMG